MLRTLRPRRRVAGSPASGFTLLELIIVIAIIGILATIALPSLIHQPHRAAEAVLRTNLLALRDSIKQYYADKGHNPTTLDALVEGHYWEKGLPRDPMTGKNDTWIPIYEEADPDQPPAESEQSAEGGPGIIDVISGAPGTSLDGTPFSEF
jgi:general secretion pathway protein G